MAAKFTMSPRLQELSESPRMLDRLSLGKIDDRKSRRGAYRTILSDVFQIYKAGDPSCEDSCQDVVRSLGKDEQRLFSQVPQEFLKRVGGKKGAGRDSLVVQQMKNDTYEDDLKTRHDYKHSPNTLVDPSRPLPLDWEWQPGKPTNPALKCESKYTAYFSNNDGTAVLRPDPEKNPRREVEEQKANQRAARLPQSAPQKTDKDFTWKPKKVTDPSFVPQCASVEGDRSRREEVERSNEDRRKALVGKPFR